MAALAAAGMTAGGMLLGSLLGGIFGSSSQSAANETNLQIARETNKQNRDLFNQSMAWQTDMWNKTNAYNDPSHQVEMLLKAGINPAAVYGNGATSMASSPSVPSAPNMIGSTVQPIDYSWLGQGISGAVNAYYNNNLTNSVTQKNINDAQISKVNAELAAQSFKHNLVKIINSAETSEYEKNMARMQMKIMDKTQWQSVLQSEWQTRIMESNYDLAINNIAESKLRQVGMDIANQYAPQMNEANLKQFQANIKAAYAAARASDASAVHMYAQAALANLQSEGVRLDNQQKDSVMDAIIDQAWNEADKSYWSAQETAKAFRVGQRYSEFAPGNDFDGRSYTNYSGRKNTYRGRIVRDKNGKRIINHY